MGGQRSGQAFALANTGELLFFAHGATAPLIVADAATRALLAERGCTVRSKADEHCAQGRLGRVAACGCACHSAIYRPDTGESGQPGCAYGVRAFPPG